jgi:predicted N-acetyltransferase YhbS
MTVETVTPDERVAEFYRRAGYAGQVQATDRVLVAIEADQWVGIVRLALEGGVTVLRGMRVLAAHQRRGIGQQLLWAACDALDGRPCYCLPYAHLTAFYGQAGFRELDPQDAPAFLAERLADYRRRRPESFTLMFRS